MSSIANVEVMECCDERVVEGKERVERGRAQEKRGPAIFLIKPVKELVTRPRGSEYLCLSTGTLPKHAVLVPPDALTFDDLCSRL